MAVATRAALDKGLIRPASMPRDVARCRVMYSFKDPKAPPARRTQYFELAANRAVRTR